MLFKFDGKYPEIGQGTYVSEEALVIGNIKIGDNCHVGHGISCRRHGEIVEYEKNNH